MHIVDLKNFDRFDLMRCFNRAFAGYFVEMPTAIDYWEKRWKAARVDFGLSYGMLDGTEIVGFIINGIDFKDDRLMAFNTGTGVIPTYRGQKIVKQLYDFAIPELRESGVESCALEVITKNEKAIRAYQSTGFKITKTLKCYSGILKTETKNHLTLSNVDFEKIDWESLPRQNACSWDNHRNAITRIREEYQYFEVLENAGKTGYFIANPQTGYLAQFDLFAGNKESDWANLFAGINKVVSRVKINNVDAGQTGKIRAIEKAGLIHLLDQYEMEYLINIEN